MEEGRKTPNLTFADIPYDKIWEIARRTGGYRIYDPAELIDLGIPQEIVVPLVREHLSGEGIRSMTRQGVGGFDLLNKICDDLGIVKESFFSDIGNQAADLVQQLAQRVEDRTSPNKAHPLLKDIFPKDVIE